MTNETIRVLIPGEGITDLPNTAEGRVKAIKVDPLNIRLLDDPTEAEQRAACEGSNYYAIKLIDEPSLELQKEAVRHDPMLMAYAPDLLVDLLLKLHFSGKIAAFLEAAPDRDSYFTEELEVEGQ